jgi:hypothetical protein
LVPAFANDAVFVYHHCSDQGIGGYLTSAATGEFEAALEVRGVGCVFHDGGFFAAVGRLDCRLRRFFLTTEEGRLREVYRLRRFLLKLQRREG